MLSASQVLHFLCSKVAAEVAYSSPPTDTRGNQLKPPTHNRFAASSSDLIAPGSSFAGDPMAHLRVLPIALRNNSGPIETGVDANGKSFSKGLDAPFTPASKWVRPARPISGYTGKYPVDVSPAAERRGLLPRGDNTPQVSYAKEMDIGQDQVGLTNLLAQRALTGGIQRTPEQVSRAQAYQSGDLPMKSMQQAESEQRQLEQELENRRYSTGVDVAVPGAVAETAYAMNSGDTPPRDARGARWIYDKILEHGPSINDKQTDIQREEGLKTWAAKLNDPNSQLGKMFKQWLNSRRTLTIRPDDIYKQTPDLSVVNDNPRVQDFLNKLQGK